MEPKRQRKRIDYARMSRNGLEAATDDDNDGYLPCSSCNRQIATIQTFSLHIASCSKVSHKCPVCADPSNPRFLPIPSDDDSIQEKHEQSEDDTKSEEKSPTSSSPKRQLKKSSEETEEKTSNSGDTQKAPAEKTFASALELDQHVAEDHAENFSFSCWVCEIRFRALTSLQRHLIKEHKVYSKTTCKLTPLLIYSILCSCSLFLF